MKIPIPRFTVRRMMIAVAVVALGCGGWHAWERINLHRRLALKHEVLAHLLREGHAHLGPDPMWAAHHEALRIKYQRAARYPWLPVAPDPPGPE